jgi:hypothetical protein
MVFAINMSPFCAKEHRAWITLHFGIDCKWQETNTNMVIINDSLKQ